MSSHLTWYSEAYDTRQLAIERAGGIKWIRDDFEWNRIEPSRGVWDWSSTDALMTAAARTEMSVLAILTFTPPWASISPGSSNHNYPPDRASDYAQFAASVAARYGRGGSFWLSHPGLPVIPLAAVELWNEPWAYWAWAPTPSPTRYAAMALAATRAVNQVDGQIKVVMPGDPIAYRDSQHVGPWLDAVLKAQPALGSVLDAYSVHPYPEIRNTSPWDDTNAPQQYSFAKVLTTRRIAITDHASKPIWITEIGWSTGPDVAESVSAATQAKYDVGAVERAILDWGAFVPRVFLYAWAPSTGARDEWDGNLPILNADGTPKPAWSALKTLLAT